MSLAVAEVAQSAGKRLRGHSFLHQQIREETRIGTAKRFAKLQDARRTQSLNHRELDGFTEQQTLVETGGHHFVKLCNLHVLACIAHGTCLVLELFDVRLLLQTSRCEIHRNTNNEKGNDIYV